MATKPDDLETAEMELLTALHELDCGKASHRAHAVQSIRLAVHRSVCLVDMRLHVHDVEEKWQGKHVDPWAALAAWRGLVEKLVSQVHEENMLVESLGDAAMYVDDVAEA